MPLEFSTITGVLPGSGIGLAGLWLLGFAGGGVLAVGLFLTSPVAFVPVRAWCTVATVTALPPCVPGAATRLASRSRAASTIGRRP